MVDVQADVYGLIALFAIGHSLVIGLLLLMQARVNKQSSLYLGLMQISGAFILVSSLLTTTNVFVLQPWLIGISYPFLFFTGFFSMLYFRSLMERDFHWDLGVWLLFSAALAGSFLSVRQFLFDQAQRLAYLQFISEYRTYPAYDWIIWTLGLLFNWGILIAALRQIHWYRKKIQREYSNTESIELRVLSRQIILFICCWAGISLLSIFSFNRLIVDLSLRMSALFPAAYLLITSWTYLLNLVESSPMPTRENPLKGRAAAKNYEQEYRIIQEEMERNRHYLDPELTLPLLAERTSFFRNELSEIINVQSGESFYHFVNGYRIRHVNSLLAENPDANILDTAFASGFNSKGAFYNAFKRVTGMTPRQYRQRQGAQQVS